MRLGGELAIVRSMPNTPAMVQSGATGLCANPLVSEEPDRESMAQRLNDQRPDSLPLHLSAGLPPMIRVDGDLRRIDVPAMDNKMVLSLLYEVMNDKQRKVFEEFYETDFSLEIPNLARFRVNVFNHERGSGGAFRTIPSEVLSLEQLNISHFP